MKKTVFWSILLGLILIITGTILTAIEYVALIINERAGHPQPFLFSNNDTVVLDTLQQKDMFKALDPLLGYAHTEEEIQRSLTVPYTYLPGFVAYTEKSRAQWQRPIIVILGGSTSDPVLYASKADAWPQILSQKMREANQPGTVVNGGVGGYSSSQELLKLVRDVIETRTRCCHQLQWLE